MTTPAPPFHPHPVPGVGKTSWPELLGNMATLAAQTIAHERPDVAVEVLPPGSHIIPGYNPKRVRLHIDNNGLVAQIPIVG